MLKIIGIEELSVILRKDESTIKVDLRRRPECIPPPVRIPGSSKLLWFESDVEDWLKKRRSKPKQGK
jgi:predicted DNA-binding transcriptional regulator AlpA